MRYTFAIRGKQRHHCASWMAANPIIVEDAQSPNEFHEEKSMVRVGTVVRTLILCGLALTTLAFAKTNQNKTQAPTVRQPIRFAISPPMFAVPQSIRSEEEVEHEVRSIHRNLGPGGEDTALQTEFGPLLTGTQGL